MKNEPKCPYCGKIMHPYRNGGANDPDVPPYWYGCTDMKCYSTSPLAQTWEEALAFAMRRPLQQPLTLQELQDLIGPGDEIVTYCEAKGADRTYANIWTGELVIDVVGYEHKNHVCFENYGKTWRAWATRPTEEERAAAPWEE